MTCLYQGSDYAVGAAVTLRVKNSQKRTTEQQMEAAGWFELSALWQPPNYLLAFRCEG